MTMDEILREETENRKYIRYLGEGVYYHYDGYSHWLEASDGIAVQHAIALEPVVLQRLYAHVDQVLEEEHKRKQALQET